MEKIDVEKFLKLNKTKRNEVLLNNIRTLCKEICELKNIEYNEDISYISTEIYYNSIYFSDIKSLCSDISYILSDDVKRVKKDDLRNIVLDYNRYVTSVKKYKEFKNKIQKEGFSNLENKYKENLKNLFIKMLDYKKQKYDKNGTLIDLIKKIDLCYYDYDYIWTALYQLLNGKCIYRDTMRDEFWLIDADYVEYLDILNKTYKYFTKDENNYKNYNQIYEDITLEENQTLEDLYNLELERIKNLFIEMLKYKNIEIKDYDYRSLKEQVMSNYKKFFNSFIHYEVVVEVDAHSSYIDMITEIRSMYKYLERNYKEN